METTVNTAVDPKEAKRIHGVNILYAIDLANLVRKVNGFPLLEDLIPGRTGDPYNCVLANSFNCGCEVRGELDSMYYMLHKTDDLSEDERYDPEYVSEIRRKYGESWNHPEPDKRNNPWWVYFFEEKYADVLAGELRTKVITAFDDEIGEDVFGVLLPEEVARIAATFDSGHFPQYEEPEPYREEFYKPY